MQQTCPLCRKPVAGLKSGSHVIPRSALTRARGTNRDRLFLLDIGNERRERESQDGKKGTFFCKDCELRTASEDAYATLIFGGNENQRRALGVSKSLCLISKRRETTKWTGLNAKKLQGFVYSVAIRDHLFRVAQGLPTLLSAVAFSSLSQAYLAEPFEEDNFPIVIDELLPEREQHLHLTVLMPSLFQGNARLGFACFGYFFQIYLRRPANVQVASAMLYVATHTALKSEGSLVTTAEQFKSMGFWNAAEPVITRIIRSEKK